MRFVDASHGEPSAQLGARASRERQTRGQLDRTWCLADDHHAIARIARDDRERRWEITSADALGARANARVKSKECALTWIRLDATAAAHAHRTRL